MVLMDKVRKLSRFFVEYIFFLSTISIYAQSGYQTDSVVFNAERIDTIITKHDTILKRYVVLYVKYDTIKEDSLYECYISKIWKLRKGSVIRLWIGYPNDEEIIETFVVTPSTKMYYEGKRIKRKRKYLLSFRRYDTVPAPKNQSNYMQEYGDVQDVMLGNTIISIPLTTMFCDINIKSEQYEYKSFYTSMDLNDDKGSHTKSYQKIKDYANDHYNIMCLVDEFITGISFKTSFPNLIHMIDTVMIKKTFCQWSYPFFKMNIRYYTHQQNTPNAPISKYRWNLYNSYSNNMNKSSCMSLLQEVLNCFYKLPKVYSENEKLEICNIKLLYMNLKVYTLLVEWKVNDDSYSIVMNVSKGRNGFKVTGLNRKVIQY